MLPHALKAAQTSSSLTSACQRVRSQPAPSEPGTGRRTGLVVPCDLGPEDLAAVDALVAGGVRASRQEAVAWLVHLGIETQRDALKRLTAVGDRLTRDARSDDDPSTKQAES